MLRTHTCGELCKKHIGQKVTLTGWVDRIRNLGGVNFVMLRDRYGLTQVIFSSEMVKGIKRESVLLVTGSVRERPNETVNPDLSTGEIEVVADSVEVLSSPLEDLPFYPTDAKPPSEEIRLKYRYIDLRNREVMNRFIIRHKVSQAVRNYLSSEDFLEIETPFLTKSTPEGARDFLVPARIKSGTFYALPQSPQIFKQLLMIAGMDRYFQIVRCFRDEDLRADRQPEFTQIDLEMSFVTMEDVIKVTEGMFKHVFREVLGVDLPNNFDRYSYNQCMNEYGSDKPDRRIGMKLFDVTDCFENTSFGVISSVVNSGGVVKALKIENFSQKTSRKTFQEFEDIVKSMGLKGLLWFTLNGGNDIRGSAIKYLKREYSMTASRLEMNTNDVCVLGAGKQEVVNRALGELRRIVGDTYFSHLKTGFDIFWVLDFPLLEWNEDEQRYVAQHHPFTMPNIQDLEEYEAKDPSKIRAQSYDIVINGFEVASGSIRIHDRDLQKRVFRLLDLEDKDVENKFGFLLEAFKYGAPPHGGIAVGLDRLIAIMCRTPSIRDVIAFPKTSSGSCPLTGAPCEVEEDQLAELGLKREGSK